MNNHGRLSLEACLLLAIMISVAGFATQKPDEIRQSGFKDFAQGTLGNSGANIYISKKGRIQVINKWDFNNDGYPDVLISGDHGRFEKVDALIYWNSNRGFKSLLPDLWREEPVAQVLFNLMDNKQGFTRLPAFGGGRSVIADLNRDGYPDIVFCNQVETYPGSDYAYIYWGGANGYKASNRTELPIHWAGGVAVADLNGDGYPDLVFANYGFEEGLQNIHRPVTRASYIYYGSATGFNPKKPFLLGTKGATDVSIADINKDGFPDIIFIENDNQTQDVRIFWGDRSGYSDTRTQVLSVPKPTSIRTGDVNGDGFPDIVVTTTGEGLSVAPQTATTGKEEARNLAYVFLGSGHGIELNKTLHLPTYQAQDSCIGDFNHDGFADIAFASSSDGKTPKVPSFVYWGSKRGFSSQARSELPTLGATGVSCVDLNGDGYPDLTFSNSDNGHTYDVPSYIYWGSPTGFAPYMRSDLQTFGAVSVSVADLNSDGKPDLLFVNHYSGIDMETGVPTNIYWGNAHHYYSTASMSSLPGRTAYYKTVADLNDDGYPDIVTVNDSAQISHIYWGGKDGYSVAHRTALPTGPALSDHAVDLNRDGYLDLVFIGPSLKGRKYAATILWGGPNGYSGKDKTVVPLNITQDAEGFMVADLNRDGYLDLVTADAYFGKLQIYWGGPNGFSDSHRWMAALPHGGNVELADLNGDGYLDFIVTGAYDPKRKSYDTNTSIYWGTPRGTPSLENPTELAAYGSLQCGVADLNHDGNLDLVCSNYMADNTRQLPIFIFWGGKGGTYSNARRTDLPAESSCGIQVVDLNGDGYPDIVVNNHVKNGRHTTYAYIYWNSPHGFNRDHRTKLRSFGAHYSQMVDPGNIYTRKLEEDYISKPLAVPEGKQVRRLSWQGEKPHGSKLKFQLRSATTREGLAKAPWVGPDGAKSYYKTSDSEVRGLRGGERWVQYRTVFTSPDGGDWPVLTEVELGLGGLSENHR